MAATLLQYMVGLGEAMEIVDEFTTTSAGTTTTLISTEFAGLGSATAMDQQWILPTSGANLGEQRHVKARAALDTSTNTLTVATAAGSSYASGITFLMSRRFPFFKAPPVAVGLRELVNAALRRLWAEDRISVSGVSGQKRYTLDQTTYPWLSDPARILHFEKPVSDADEIPERFTGPWSMTVDGETVYLNFPGAPWKSGESFVMVVHRPANSRLRISSAWADQSSEIAGLTLVTESALATVRDVTIVGQALAYRALARKAPGEEATEWNRLAKHWAGVASRLKAYRVPRNHTANVVNLNPTTVVARAYR